MTPRKPSPNIRDYRPVLSIAARDELMALAESLAFVVDQPGRYDGGPSVRLLLESLATAHRNNPRAVRDALRALGVFWQPEPPEDNAPDTPSS